MNAKPLSELDILGWPGAELARRLGLADRTVSRWRTGRVETPEWVTAYLTLAVFIHEKGYRVP